jgi:hypothetical protein
MQTLTCLIKYRAPRMCKLEILVIVGWGNRKFPHLISPFRKSLFNVGNLKF